MSIKIKVGSKRIQDTFYTLTPINWVLRIFILSNVKRKENTLIQCWSLTENLIVCCVMLIINIFFLKNKIQTFEGHNGTDMIKFTDTIQLTFLLAYTEYIMDVINVYKTRHTSLKYLQFYSTIDKILGIPNFSRIRTNNMIAIASLITSFMVSSSIDYFCWFLGYGWIPPTLYSLDYFYLFLNSLTVLDVVSNVVQIEYRLKVMINLLEECYATSTSLTGSEVEGWVFFTSNRMPADNKLRVDGLRTVTYNKYFEILSLSKYYVLLIEQVAYINKAYGIRLGAFCLNILIYAIHLINVIIRISLDQFVPLYSNYHLPAVSSTIRIINYAAVFLIMLYHCEETYKQSDGIVRLIDLIVVNKKIPNDLKNALTELRTLVLSRPIKFHGANFFTLDYPLLVSMTSVCVTYTIILLQSVH